MTNFTPQEEPRFGRRSDPGANAAAEQSTGEFERVPTEPQQQTPWPQYGQVSESLTDHLSRGGTAQFAAQVGQPGSSADGSGVHGAPGGPAPQMWMPGDPATPRTLTSRVPATVLTVIGALLMLVIAPVVAIIVGITSLSANMSGDNSMGAISSGDTVTVDQTGTYAAYSFDDTRRLSCSLSNGEQTVKMQYLADNYVIANNLTPGEYTFECDSVPSSAIYGMSGTYAEAAVTSVMVSFAVGSVLGVAGIIMLIVGIVWLVRVNKQRRQQMHRYYYG